MEQTSTPQAANTEAKPLSRHYTGMFTKDILHMLQPYFVGKALDVGAGTTKYSTIILKTATSYTASDSFPGKHIDVVCDAHNLPFPDGSYDTVICTGVLEHVRQPWIVAKELERMVKPGGHLIVAAPFMVGYHADPHDYFRFSMEGMNTLFTNVKILELSTYGGFFELISSAAKFGFCNPYTMPHPGLFRRNIFRVVQKVCKVLDKFSPAKGTFYEMVLLIARK